MPKPPRIITDLMVQKQDTCPHWVYFDAFGDKRHRAKETPWTALLREQRLIEEEQVVAVRGPYEKPAGKTPAARAKATLKLMAAGAERIYKPVLAAADLRAEPDLLERRDDADSDFGAYYYVALDVRGGERITEAMKVRAVFYGELLAEIQNARPPEGYIITADGSVFSFSLDENEHRLHDLLAEIDAALAGECPPPHLAAACKQSPWFKECVHLAERENDVALLYNIKRRAVRHLRDLGFNTVADVAAMEVAKFAGTRPDLTEALLTRAQLQARALLEKRRFRRAPYQLPPAGTEIFFDIEADGLRGNYDYLYGFLIRDRDGLRYEKFVAEKPADQEAMWKQFLRWFGPLTHDCVIYHFGDHERHSLAVLESRYGGSKPLTRFRQQMRDLNEIVKESFVLPLYFYGLKEIGGYIGYERQAEITHGAASIEYYEEWLSNGDRRQLDAVIEYNREDCEATMALKDWLVKEAETASLE